MVYTWCDIISQQLQSGHDYSLLKPVYSIWLLAENLLPGETDYAHEYKLQNRQGRTLADLGGIHLLELKKFTAERIETEEQRWLQFFKEGDQLDESALPDWMNTDEMRQAMKTLKLFSDKERDYHAYQARQNYLREQRTIQIEREEDLREMERIKQEKERIEQEKEQIKHDMEQAQQDLQRERLEKQAALHREEDALQREQAALQEKQSAQAEIERLKALLVQSKQ
jgi:DNA repair exonuclease SbcCD ATPase subunit